MNKIIGTYPLNGDTFNTGKTLYVFDFQAKQLQQVYPRSEFINLISMGDLTYLFDYEKEKYIISISEYDVEIKTLASDMRIDED